MLSGVLPVLVWKARKNELGGSKPSRKEISAPDILEVLR